MAITTTTITKNAGWARTDVIDQLEQAFTFVSLHGAQISGLVTSISAYSGGGTVGSANTDYFDVPIATTSGIGTGATFDVYRNSGSVNAIYVNRPGKGYVNNEYVTLNAADIGGSVNGAVAIGITVLVDGGASPVGYGSTNQFFDKNLAPASDSARPWAVLKQDFNTSKRFGVTYRGFKAYSDSLMGIYAGSSFFPFNTTNNNDKGGQYRDSFRGTYLLDISTSPASNDSSLDHNSDAHAQISGQYDQIFQYASTNSPTTHALKLNVYRSGIDSNFAVLSFNQPSISGTLNDSTFTTFIIHNFNSVLYNFDETFSAGLTLIDKDPSISTNNGSTGMIGFKTFLVGNYYTPSNRYLTTRTAEAGYSQIYDQDDHYGLVVQNYSIATSQSNYTSSTGSGQNNYESIGSGFATIYSRTGGFKDTGELTSNSSTYGNKFTISTYNAVIKGIPINGNLIPCPYYMPDDFVVIDFKLAASGQDVKQGDTITISASEVYTVITGSYNKSNETAGVLFCARTV